MSPGSRWSCSWLCVVCGVRPGRGAGHRDRWQELVPQWQGIWAAPCTLLLQGQAAWTLLWPSPGASWGAPGRPLLEGVVRPVSAEEEQSHLSAGAGLHTLQLVGVEMLPSLSPRVQSAQTGRFSSVCSLQMRTRLLRRTFWRWTTRCGRWTSLPPAAASAPPSPPPPSCGAPPASLAPPATSPLAPALPPAAEPPAASALPWSALRGASAPSASPLPGPGRPVRSGGRAADSLPVRPAAAVPAPPPGAAAPPSSSAPPPSAAARSGPPGAGLLPPFFPPPASARSHGAAVGTAHLPPAAGARRALPCPCAHSPALAPLCPGGRRWWWCSSGPCAVGGRRCRCCRRRKRQSDDVWWAWSPLRHLPENSSQSKESPTVLRFWQPSLVVQRVSVSYKELQCVSDWLKSGLLRWFNCETTKTQKGGKQKTKRKQCSCPSWDGRRWL